MPESSEAQRNRMRERFGDGIDSHGPQKFLESRGYKLLRNFLWVKPTPEHYISDDEMECLLFLRDEWDYGGTTDA